MGFGPSVQSGGWGSAAPSGSASSRSAAASPRLALREAEVVIPVDAAGRPCKLGEGAHGQVPPVKASARTWAGTGCSQCHGSLRCSSNALFGLASGAKAHEQVPPCLTFVSTRAGARYSQCQGLLVSLWPAMQGYTKAHGQVLPRQASNCNLAGGWSRSVLGLAWSQTPLAGRASWARAHLMRCSPGRPLTSTWAGAADSQWHGLLKCQWALLAGRASLTRSWTGHSQHTLCNAVAPWSSYSLLFTRLPLLCVT